MVGLSPAEFERGIHLLSDEVGFERLKDRFVRTGAFTSKRGLGSVRALADRLYMLSGGLRRDVPASYAFQSLWNETFTSRIRDQDEQTLTEMADRINGCLSGGKEIDPEKALALDEALGAYHQTAANVLGDEVARLDMLLKAVPSVADRIRSWPGNAPPGRPEHREPSRLRAATSRHLGQCQQPAPFPRAVAQYLDSFPERAKREDYQHYGDTRNEPVRTRSSRSPDLVAQGPDKSDKRRRRW